MDSRDRERDIYIYILCRLYIYHSLLVYCTNAQPKFKFVLSRRSEQPRKHTDRECTLFPCKSFCKLCPQGAPLTNCLKHHSAARPFIPVHIAEALSRGICICILWIEYIELNTHGISAYMYLMYKYTYICTSILYAYV